MVPLGHLFAHLLPHSPVPSVGTTRRQRSPQGGDRLRREAMHPKALHPVAARSQQAFIYSHLPLEEWWQLLDTYISAQQFWEMPTCGLLFFTKV